MNTGNQNDGIMYKAAAFAIFVVLVTLIVLATISSRSSDEIPQPSAASSKEYDSSVTVESESTETTAPSSENPKETTSAPITTAPPQITSAPASNTVSDPIDVPASNTSDDVAAFLANYPNTVLPVSEDAGQEYIDKIIFLGDSTTYGLRANAVLNGGKNTTQVWTPTNGYITLSQVNTVLIWYPETDTEMSIKDAVALKKPEYMVITLGVNGISFMSEDYFKKEYGKLISSIQDASPDTKIILQSIFPVATNYESLKSINNELIDTANRWIVELADSYGTKYVDTNSALRGSDGWLISSYQNGDGLHLTAEGLNIELNNLRTHAWVD